MVKHVNKEELENIINEGKSCIVDFFASWCGPCQMLGPVFEEVASNEKYVNKIQFIKIDIDKEDSLALDYNVEVVPTLVFIKEKNVIKKEEGYKSKEELENIIENIL